MAGKTVKPATSSKAGTIDGAYVEFGATGLKQYSGYIREEWQRELIGRRGLLIYREMYDSDPIVGAVFYAITMLLRGVDFHIEAGDSKSQSAADFVESCLGDMETSWSGFLAELMPFLLYGWDVHEIVYKIRKGRSKDKKFNSKYDDGMIGWRNFCHRGQETLLHWVFDQTGCATDMVQLLPTGGPLLTVPLEKCLHFRTTPFKNNPEGRSIFRNAYTSYFMKKYIQEVEAIGVTRDLTGLTVVRVPARWTLKNASPEDRAALEQAKIIARDTARNQQEGLVLPVIRNKQHPELLEFDVELLATGGRRQIVTSEIITRYNELIAQSVLADFITLGGSGSSGRGSYSQSKNKSDMFASASMAYLDLICDEVNRAAIPDLLYLNGMEGADVRLAHGDIQRRDLQGLAVYLLDAFQAGVLTPDSQLEAFVREEAGLPAQDQDSMRDLGGGGAGSDDEPGAADGDANGARTEEEGGQDNPPGGSKANANASAKPSGNSKTGAVKPQAAPAPTLRNGAPAGRGAPMGKSRTYRVPLGKSTGRVR